MNRITFGNWSNVPGFGLRADTFKNNHYIGVTERNNNGLVYFDRLGETPGFDTYVSDNIVTLAAKL